MEQSSLISDAERLVLKAGEIREVDGAPFIMRATSDGGQELVELERLMKAPLRICETVRVLDVDSFVEYFNRFNFVAPKPLLSITEVSLPGERGTAACDVVCAGAAAARR